MTVGVHCSNIYTSTGTNRRRNIVAWSQNSDAIAFGSCNKICIVSNKDAPQHYQIVSSLAGHDELVMCVSWIADSKYLCSSSADGVVCIWTTSENKSKLEMICKIPAHTLSADFVTGLLVGEELYVVSCSIDCTLKLHAIRLDQECKSDPDLNVFSLVQSINFGSNFALCADLIHVDKTIVLAVGCNDCTIHLFTKTYDDKEFQQVHKLAGHTDWVTDVQFNNFDSDVPADTRSFLLATCSQDTYARVWRFQLRSPDDEDNDPTAKDILKLDQKMIRIAQHQPAKNSTSHLEYSVSLETVLAGHEGWVYSIRWCPGTNKECPRLITASIDKCVIEWEPDPVSGVWYEKTRIGDVGGNSLGFYGAVYSSCGSSILAHSYAGGLHLWTYDKVADRWEPQVVPTGHFGPVEDLSWDPNGNYVLSVSADQTTRLHGVWSQQGCTPTFHELARTQVHGYDMQCIASLSSCSFVSAGEEKILRSFTASRIFRDNFASISRIELPLPSDKFGDGIKLAEGASVPSLGLTNKAVFSELEESSQSAEAFDQGPLHYFTPVRLQQPPTEDHLLQNTLWPEVHKMYGHGYEVFCVAANSTGTLFASACKGSKPEHTTILLWSAGNWQQVGTLAGHSLTVTQLEFSPNNRYLLSVSRDRSWCLFEKDGSSGEAESWRVVGRDLAKGGAHSRIIWTCSWSHNSMYFATGSRDKKCALWKVSDSPIASGATACRGCVELVCSVVLNQSVTAVDFAPAFMGSTKYLLAIGLESGHIELHSFDSAANIVDCLDTKDCSNAHSKTVKRLQFRPVLGRLGLDQDGGDEKTYFQLASASEDHSIRIYDVLLLNDLS